MLDLRRIACLTALAASVGAASAADRSTPPLNERQLAALGAMRVVVMFRDLDDEQAEQLVQSTGRLAFETLAPNWVAGAAAVNAAVSTGTYSTALSGSAMGMTVAPVALFVGIGAFAGSVQQRNRAVEEAHRLTDAMRIRLDQQAPVPELERRFVAALRAELEASGIAVAGEVEVQHLHRLRPRDPFGDVVEGTAPDDPRALLVVLVRSALPLSLSAYTMTAEARAYGRVAPEVRAEVERKYKWRKPSTRATPGAADYDPEDWLDAPLYRSAPMITVLSPVPLADLYRKPAAWLEREEREVNERYDTMLAASASRDTRRELRTLRNAALDDVRGPWQLVQLAEHMVEAWQGPSGPRFAEIVVPGVEGFGRYVARSLRAPPP